MSMLSTFYIESFHALIINRHLLYPKPQTAYIISIFTFMNTAFPNQGDIYTSVTANMTYNEVVCMVELWANNGTGLPLSNIK